MPRNYQPKNKHLSDPNIPKEGRLSNQEKQYIADHCEEITVEEIALKLQRNPKSIKAYLDTYIREKRSQGEDTKLMGEFDIKLMPFFEQLKEQYSKRELQTIEYHWNKLISQFKDDALHTEQMQILQYAETMIEIARIKKMNRASELQIEKLEARLVELHETDREDRDARWEARSNAVERQMSDIRNSRKPVAEEMARLVKQSNDLLVSLNATRGQRIKVASDDRMDLTGLLKALADDPFRKKAVRHNKLMQLSAELERLRLAQDYLYMDGIYDKPLLNSDTVREPDEKPIEGDYI